MPPLQCLGRRWRTGSDDFVLSGILFGLALIAVGIASAVIIGYSGNVCALSVADPSASAASVVVSSVDSDALVLMRIQSIALLATGLVMGLLAAMSGRGRIMEPSRRATTVPLMLYATFVGLTMIATISVVLAVLVYGGSDKLAPCRVEGAHHGMRSRAIGHGQTIFGFLPLALFGMLFMAAYDPSGRKAFTEHNAHTYADLWDKRFGWLVCRCFRRDEASKEAFREIANAFTNVFQGVDLVPSDVAAGMVLVHGHQQRVLGEGVKGTVYPPPSHDQSSSADDGGCCCDDVVERVSRQARPFGPSPLAADLQAHVETLFKYRRFFMAAYGWALAVFKDPLEAVPMMCCSKARCCYCCCNGGGDAMPWAPHAKGETCMCDTNILLQSCHLREEDVIITDFRNGLYQSPHFVVIDQSEEAPSEKAVVIGIRGSMSLDDALTDLVAQPSELLLRSDALRALGPAHVHGGMLRTTENILASLEEANLVEDLIHGKYKDLKVVLVGHSLGAGTVVILSILMRDRYPALIDRLKCVAYAPPGGLLSKNLSDYTADYVVGGFFGVDIVPRLALHTVEDLRTSIIDALCAAESSKAAVFCNALNPTRTRLLGEDAVPTGEVLRARDKLLKSGVMPAVLQHATTATAASSGVVFSGSSGAVVSGDGAINTAGSGSSPLTGGGGPITNSASRADYSAASGSEYMAPHLPMVTPPNDRTPLTPRSGQSGSAPLPPSFGTMANANTATTAINMNATTTYNASTSPAGSPHTSLRTIRLYPPGRMVHFVKAVTRDTRCLFGAWTWDRAEYYVPTHITPEAVQEIVCCPRMLTDHFPNNFFSVIESTHAHLHDGTLGRFMQKQSGGVSANNTAPPPPPLAPTHIAITIPQQQSSHYAGGLTSISYRFPNGRAASSSAVVGVGNQDPPMPSNYSSNAASSTPSHGSADGGYAPFSDGSSQQQRRAAEEARRRQ